MVQFNTESVMIVHNFACGLHFTDTCRCHLLLFENFFRHPDHGLSMNAFGLFHSLKMRYTAALPTPVWCWISQLEWSSDFSWITWMHSSCVDFCLLPSGTLGSTVCGVGPMERMGHCHGLQFETSAGSHTNFPCLGVGYSMWGFLFYTLDRMGLLCELNGIEISLCIAFNNREKLQITLHTLHTIGMNNVDLRTTEPYNRNE